MLTRHQCLMTILVMLLLPLLGWGEPRITQPGGDPIGSPSKCVVNGDVPTRQADGTWACAQPPGAGAGAPAGSGYITKTPDATLTGELALSGLATGIVLNTTTTGVLTIYGGASCTNQFARSQNASGGWTCASVALTDLSFDPATQAELDTHTGLTTSVHGIANTANLVLKDGSVAQDKLTIVDTDGTPVANRQWQVKDGLFQTAATGGIEGRYVKKESIEVLSSAEIGADSVALGTKTTGNYVGQLTAGTGVTLDNCTPGEGVNCTINATVGGTSNEKTPAALATTGNLTLSGEQTIDGTLTSTTRLLVWQQTDATANGIYTTGAGAWSRTTDVDTGAEFTGNFVIYVQSGTLHGGKTFRLTNTGAVTLGVTNIGFAADSKDEKLANKNAASGYAGLDSAAKLLHTQLGSYAAHAPLAAASTIIPTKLMMGIEGSGGPVDLTSNPQVDTSQLVAQQLLIFVGTHPTNSVKLDNGTGFRMCGDTGSVTVKRGGPTPIFRYDGTVLEELGCRDGQGWFNVSNILTIGACGTSAALILQAAGGGDYHEICIDNGTPITKAFSSGQPTDMVMQLAAGRDMTVKKHDGTTLFNVDNDTGTITGAGITDIGARIFHNAAQSISTGTYVTLAFNSESYDTDAMHDLVTNNSRITIKTAGKYLVNCRIRFAANATGDRFLHLQLNGTAAIAEFGGRPPQGAGQAHSVQSTTIRAFAVNDYIEALVWQDSGGPLNVDSTSGGDERSPYCEVQKVN